MLVIKTYTSKWQNIQKQKLSIANSLINMVNNRILPIYMLMIKNICWVKVHLEKYTYAFINQQIE